MTTPNDPCELLDAYADEPSGRSGFDRDDHAPKAFAALRAVLDLLDNPDQTVYDAWEEPSVHIEAIERAITTALE